MAAKKTAKKTAAKKTAKEASAGKPAKKAVAKKTAGEKPPSKPAKAQKKSAPPLEVVARGAYLNYRRRVEQGLPGDSHGDWIEAERQLGDLDQGMA